MSATLPRRRLLTTGGAAAAVVGLSSPVAQAGGKGGRPAAEFTLDAEVLDGGEQVVSLTVAASRLGAIRESSLTARSFSVHATATNPLTGTVAYDLDRVVTSARLDRRGDIVLELSHGEGQSGAGTLEYVVDVRRNVLLDLTYTITQNAPLQLRRGGTLTIRSFTQGGLSDPEVDAFTSRISASGMNYRLFAPSSRRSSRRKRPLIVWLHGGGEGGALTGDNDYYDNEAPLRANRGALGFTTAQAQKAFDGAFVVAPQCTSAWMDDGPAFAPLVDEVIQEVCARHPVDRDRIHVVGCSNGGYMTLKMVVEHPAAFASAVPICGVVDTWNDSTEPLVPDAALEAIDTPTWLVASADDTTVDPEANTVHAHELIPDSIMSLYDTVTWDGIDFPGHWSWIYVARNDPRHEGTRIWQWMASQTD